MSFFLIFLIHCGSKNILIHIIIREVHTNFISNSFI